MLKLFLEFSNQDQFYLEQPSWLGELNGVLGSIATDLLLSLVA